MGRIGFVLLACLLALAAPAAAAAKTTPRTHATAPAPSPVAALPLPMSAYVVAPSAPPPAPAPAPAPRPFDVPVITFLTLTGYTPGTPVDEPATTASLVASPAPGGSPLAWLRVAAPLVGLIGIGAVLARARLVAPTVLPPKSEARMSFASADDPVALLAAAKDAVQQDRLDEAVLWFDHALRLRPELAIAHFCRGVCLVGLGRHEDAYSSLKRAYEIDPQEGAHRLELARACGRTGRATEAMRVLGPLLEAAPDLMGEVREDPAFSALSDHPLWLAMTGSL